MALTSKPRFVTTPERSRIMAAVRSRGNASTEVVMAAAFRASKITGWRRQMPILLPTRKAAGWRRSIVRPDFAFPAFKIAVFVDGDFWHGNPKRLRMPVSNAAYWADKIKHNRYRDKDVNRRLVEKAWVVVRIWESTLKTRPKECIARVIRSINRSKTSKQ